MAVRVTMHTAVLTTGGVASFARVTLHLGVILASAASNARVTMHAGVILASAISFAKVTMHVAVILCAKPIVNFVRFRPQVIG